MEIIFGGLLIWFGLILLIIILGYWWNIKIKLKQLFKKKYTKTELFMKTFSEINNQKPFNWFEALSQENISDEQWEKLKDMAESWVTCACGNQCAIIPRDEEGRPEDEFLVHLGGGDGFFKAIEKNNKDAALQYLQFIEIRSKYLIEQEVKKHKEALSFI